MKTRIGLLGARGDNRGLSIVTREFARHMEPDKVLGIDLGDLSYKNNWSGFRNLEVTSYPVKPSVFGEWFQDLDRVYAVETPYEYEAFLIAKLAGVKTYLHVMPELYRWAGDPHLPRPDVELAPTTWATDAFMPLDVLPIPVATDRLPFRLREQATTFLHPVGHPAALDRAGTQLVLESLQHITANVRVVVRCKQPINARPVVPSNVELIVDREALPNYWEQYENADVLLAPRRYAGVSLPLQEALACGMPVIALDREPERSMLPGDWLVPTTNVQMGRMQGGKIPVYDADARDIAAKVDELAGSPERMKKASWKAGDLGEALSWRRLIDRYEETFRA